MAEYADAYKEVQDLLSEADSAEEMAGKIEVLAQKYGKLNVLRKYLGLVGDVVTDKGGYKLQIPQTGSDNVNPSRHQLSDGGIYGGIRRAVSRFCGKSAVLFGA